jgi:hypothetical protein
MRRVHGLAIVTVAVFLIQVTAEASAAVIYDYRGNEFEFCGFGCPDQGPEPDVAPPNWDDDFVIASLTFDAPLAPNLTFDDEVRTGLIAFTMTDKLGTFFLSGSELPDGEEDGETIPGLKLATDGSGNIISWVMTAFHPDSTSAGIFNPVVHCPDECGPGIADFVAVENAQNDEWDAFSFTPGQWQQRAVPEPATVALSLVALGGFAIRRRQNRLHR